MLPGGDYVFRVVGQATKTGAYLAGTYDFRLFTLDDVAAVTDTHVVDVSEAAVEATVTGSSSTGAGFLETSASVERYEFTVPEESDVQVRIDPTLSTSGTGPWLWELTDDDGDVVDSGELKGDVFKQPTLPAGDFVLTIHRNPDDVFGGGLVIGERAPSP